MSWKGVCEAICERLCSSQTGEFPYPKAQSRQLPPAQCLSAAGGPELVMEMLSL